MTDVLNGRVTTGLAPQTYEQVTAAAVLEGICEMP